ncbi:MAG: arsenite methyltransferase [Opitutales bacterium]
MTNSPRNFSMLLERLDRLPTLGWEKSTLGTVDGGYPILSFERIVAADAPTVLLVGGIHGDEPAGTEAAVQWMETPRPEHDVFNWLVIPCANPYGWERNRRTNSCNRDLNRNFRSPDCCEECAALIRATEGRRFLFSMNFHEDNEAPGFYICEIKKSVPFGGERIIEAVSDVLPIWKAERLDGRRAAADGCVRRFPVTAASLERRRFWPLEFHLLRSHTDHTYCTETPTLFPMEQRVAAHHAALQAACTFAKPQRSMNKNHILQQDGIRDQVRERYGRIAERDTRGCCGDDKCCGATGGVLESGTDPELLGYRPEDAGSVPEGSEMGLGCGNPTAIEAIRPGETVLDLGSGGGFDCFLAARRVGAAGKVIGVDMTPAMVSKARANAAKGNFPQVEFRLGEIEHLPVADNSIDRILSNCVINLSPDKPQVLAEAFRVLRPGGRLAVADIVLLKPLPEALKANVEAYTGCVAGALEVEEYDALLAAAGFVDIRVEVKESSRTFINQWVPGMQAGDYVASGNITASKPRA